MSPGLAFQECERARAGSWLTQLLAGLAYDLQLPALADWIVGRWALGEDWGPYTPEPPESMVPTAEALQNSSTMEESLLR